MIGPNMATMLGLVLTDAPIAAADAQQTLSAVVDDTFNCISVDGHMSTNDTVLLVANGAAGGEQLSATTYAVSNRSARSLRRARRQIPADGEGATHLITHRRPRLRTRRPARQIARTIADSPLVKTAIAGGDPNWGRIVSAAGYAGVPFDPAKVDLPINGVLLYREARPSHRRCPSLNPAATSRETAIELAFRGPPPADSGRPTSRPNTFG